MTGRIVWRPSRHSQGCEVRWRTERRESTGGVATTCTALLSCMLACVASERACMRACVRFGLFVLPSACPTHCTTDLPFGRIVHAMKRA